MKRITCVIVAVSMAFCLFIGSAQSQEAGPVADPSVTPSAETVNTTNRVRDTDDDDNEFDMGWIGLAGLAGLAGLMRKNPDVHRVQTSDTARR